MPITRKAVVSPRQFSGLGKVASADLDGLASVVNDLLVKAAQVRLETESITALTDSSGGTDGSTVAAAVMPAETDISGGVLGATAASVNTAVDTVVNAYAVMLEQLNLVFAEFTLGVLEEGVGTIALSGTIAVIDDTVAANTTDNDSLGYAAMKTVFQELLDAQATIIEIINVSRRAVGLGVLTQAAGGGFTQGTIGVGLDIQAGAFTNTASVTGGVSSALRSEIDPFLDVLSDNVAYFATSIDEVTNITEATNVMTHVAG